MGQFTDPELFALQVIHAADTPVRRARSYRTIADLYEAHLIEHATAQQLLDMLDRRSPMGDTLGMDAPAQGVN